MTFTDMREAYGLPLFFDEGAKFFDWNNDGYIDLVLHDSNNNGPSLFQFDGHTFTRIDDVFPPATYINAWGLNAEDVDGDGYLDVIVSRSSDESGPILNPTLFLKRGGSYISAEFWSNPDSHTALVGF